MQSLKTHTANGVPIVPGLRIFTNDLLRGTVQAGNPHIEPDGMPWWPVLLDNGRDTECDGWRMTTMHPFTKQPASEVDKVDDILSHRMADRQHTDPWDEAS